MDVLLTVRVDVEFLPTAPITDVWVNRPWAHANRLFVPDWEHYEGELFPSTHSCIEAGACVRTLRHASRWHLGINDRFVYGARARVRDYIEARWRRIQPSSNLSSEAEPPPIPVALAKAWGVSPQSGYPACLIAERLSCWYVTTRNVSVGFSAAKFVRVRADLQTPDVDRAIVSNVIPVRAWMRNHARLCASLKCSGGGSALLNTVWSRLGLDPSIGAPGSRPSMKRSIDNAGRLELERVCRPRPA